MFHWKWPESTYRRVGYVFESGFFRRNYYPISIHFGVLNKERWNFKKMLFNFLVSIKTFEISAYIFNRIFTKNVNNFEILRQIFPLLQHLSLRALLVLYLQVWSQLWPYNSQHWECWANVTLKCYANTFVKADAQIEEGCWLYLLSEQVFLPKLYCKKLSNQKPTANTVYTTWGITLCWIRGEIIIKELLFIKITLYL